MYWACDITMGDVAHFLRVGLGCWLLAMAAVLAWQMLRRRIRLVGILTDRLADGGRAVNMDRLQLLVVFLVAVAAYSKTVLDAMSGATPLTEMPAPPDMLVETVLASKGIYLGGKLGRRMQGGGLQ